MERGSDPKDQTEVRNMRDTKDRCTVQGQLCGASGQAGVRTQVESVELGGSEANHLESLSAPIPSLGRNLLPPAPMQLGKDGMKEILGSQKVSST